MILRRLAGIGGAAALLLSGAAAVAQSAPGGTVAAALAATAAGPCVDLVSGAAAWPQDNAAQEALLGGYGLTSGMPQGAMSGLGPAGTTLVSGATLAHREASDGGFVMALGGAQPLCRLILYRVADAAATKAMLFAALTSPVSGWKEAPSRARAAVDKRMFVRRNSAGKPMLLNVLSPVDPAARPSLMLTVAAIPPNVTLPQGF